MDPTRILTRDEVFNVLNDLQYRARRSVNSWQNLILFRLSCCCGLRVKEICGLNIGDVTAVGPGACIKIRKAITKGKAAKRRVRRIPLSWSPSTQEDIAKWIAKRVEDGALLTDPVVCVQRKDRPGKRLTREVASRRWKTAIRCLGPERVRQLSIHCGRHSFASHAIFRGRDIVSVRDAMGHANISTTSVYSHVLDAGDLPDVFGE